MLDARNRQTLELLLEEEHNRIDAEYDNGATRTTNLEDSTVAHFQDVESMTFGEWDLRIRDLEKALLSETSLRTGDEWLKARLPQINEDEIVDFDETHGL